MDSNSSPNAALQTRFSPVWRVEYAAPEAKPVEQTKAPVAEVEKAAPQAELTSPDMVVEIDKAAGRFVNTLIDGDTSEIIRKYPSETQLAYSRAVSAYLRALSQG